MGERDWAGRHTQYRHDALGRLISKSLNDGSEQHYRYNEQDQLSRMLARGHCTTATTKRGD